MFTKRFDCYMYC